MDQRDSIQNLRKSQYEMTAGDGDIGPYASDRMSGRFNPVSLDLPDKLTLFLRQQYVNLLEEIADDPDGQEMDLRRKLGYLRELAQKAGVTLNGMGYGG